MSQTGMNRRQFLQSSGVATLAAENIAAVLQGRRPPTPVNPEVLAQ